MELDDLLNSVEQIDHKKVEKYYRKKYNNELEGFKYFLKNDLSKLNLGGTLKFISLKDDSIKTAILVDVCEQNGFVKLLRVLNINSPSKNKIYKLKANNYIYFYKNKNLYRGIHALFDEIEKNN